MPSTKTRLETVEKLIKATGIQCLAGTVAWLREYQLPATNDEAETYLEFWRPQSAQPLRDHLPAGVRPLEEVLHSWKARRLQ